MGVDVIESRTKTARKSHRCDYCGEIIEKGEEYSYQKTIFDGAFYEWHTHLACSRVASAIWDYVDPESFYIGYQTADTKMAELSKKCERLRIENVMLKDAEAEKSELQRTIDEMSEEHRKRLERANIERQRLLKKIEELENVNAELVRSVPEDAPVGDDTESKLEYAFLTLHLTDREAAEYARCAPAKAWRYRKDKGIEPKGGKT